MADSERAITTAARALYEAYQGPGSAGWSSLSADVRKAWLKHAEEVVNAARPLIVREEHDRLRRQIRAMPAPSQLTRDLGQHYLLDRAGVLALLPAEQANE